MKRKSFNQISRLIDLLRQKLKMEEEIHFCVVGLLNDLILSQGEKDEKQIKDRSTDKNSPDYP